MLKLVSQKTLERYSFILNFNLRFDQPGYSGLHYLLKQLSLKRCMGSKTVCSFVLSLKIFIEMEKVYVFVLLSKSKNLKLTFKLV